MIKSLLSAAAYAHPVSRIELLETHISWVVLTGEFAYKIKKPVNLGFVDFSDLEKRRHYCEEELRLNRSWAPRLYLDVLPIVRRDGRVRVGGEGAPIDYAVRMRQFDQAMRLDHLIEAGRLAASDVLELAGEIARRHAAARRVEPDAGLLTTTERLIWDNFRELEGEVPDAFLDRLRRWMKSRLDGHANLNRQRIDAGYFRECHGDLHLANIVRLPEGIRAYDCIEFSEELREIDVVADYAFLTMDFLVRGTTGLAAIFVNRYLEKTGDYDGASLLPVYLIYRAMVRAKVAAIGREQHAARTDRAGDRHTIARYCAFARALVSERRPVLVLMNGLSGSGKTWLSTRLIAALPAVRLRSDLERRRLFGLEETVDSGSALSAGIYDRHAGTVVYRHLADSARRLLRAGLNVILDATFLDAENRRLARAVAADCGVSCVIVEAAAAHATLMQRLRQRPLSSDASEADAQVLRHQIETGDPLTDSERATTITVHTDQDVDIPAIAARVRGFRY